MSEPQRDPNASAPGVKRLRREIRWDAAAAIIASLVGLLALIVAGYTAHIQRQQVRAQVWPYLIWASSYNQTEYIWFNKGVGPAVIKSVQVLVDGNPQHNWDGVLHAMRLNGINVNQSTLNRNVLSAGEKLDWLKFQDHADFQKFRAATHHARLDFKVCYCSTLGDCWVVDSPRRDGKIRVPVGKCPAIPEAQQFDD